MSQLRAPTKRGTLLVNARDTYAETNGFSYPTSPAIRSPLSARNPKLENRLREAWLRAEKQFLKDTGRELGGYDIKNAQGILKVFKQKYDADGSDSKKSSSLDLGTLVNVLNAVEIVGAFAAQAVSTVFGPAEMCFSAVSFLLTVPAQIKKVYEDLEALFREIELFLTKFKIYQRIEDGAGLGDELFENTNNLLTCFVKVCGTAAKVLQGGFRDRLKNNLRVVLLQDNRVGDALEEFKKLCGASDSLANTVMLEHVMSSEADVKAILNSSQKIEGGIGILLARSNDEKTSLVNSDRVNRIRKWLFTHPPTEDLLSSVSQENNEETFEALQDADEFRQWLHTESPRSTLAIYGPSGSGKSYMLEAVREHLNNRRENASRGDRSIYVAKHSFDERVKTTEDYDRATATHDALRKLAYQVAMQSTSYAKELSGLSLESLNLRSEKDLKKLFTSLRLSQITTSLGATMYILLDGVEADDYSARGTNKHLRELLDLFMDPSSQSDLQIKILLVADTCPDVPQSNKHSQYSTLSVDAVNAKLMLSFAVEEMQRRNFQQDLDKDTAEFRKTILEKLTNNTSDLTFKSIRQRLIQLQEAIDEDRPQTDMSKILEAKNGEDQMTDEGLEILRDVEKGLNLRAITLLNKIVAFTLYNPADMFSLKEVEALLYLDNIELPIEPLGKRIRRSFDRVLYASEDYVYLNWEVDSALIEMGNAEDPANVVDQEAARITLDIQIKNASEQDVRKFVWDLNEHMTAGKFDFSLARAQASAPKIRVNEIEARLDSIRLLSMVISQGSDTKTECLVGRAYVAIPRYLPRLQELESKLSATSRKMIGEALITYLTDTHYARLNHHDYDYYWMFDDDLSTAMRFWLEDQATIETLRPRDQRWVRELTDHSLGKLGFAKDMAVAICNQWLSDVRSNSHTLYNWIDSYLMMNTEIPPPSPPPSEGNGDSDIESNAETSEENVQPVTPSSPTQETANTAETIDTNHEESTKSDGNAEQEVVAEDNAEVLTTVQRIERATTWAREKGSITLNDSYNTTLGNTYYSAGEYAIAISYFEKVSADYTDRYISEIGHAQCALELEDLEAALKHSHAGLKRLRTEADNKSLSEADLKSHLGELKLLGDRFADLERPPDALSIYEEILAQTPEDCLCRWKAIKLYCQLDDTQSKGYETLMEWTKDGIQFCGKTLAASLSETITSDEYDSALQQLARTIKRQDMQNLLVDIIDEALQLAVVRGDLRAQVFLQNLKGRVFAFMADLTSMTKAVKVWLEMLETRVVKTDPHYWDCYEFSRTVAQAWIQYEVEITRVRLLVETSLNINSKRNIAIDVKSKFDQVIDSSNILRDNRGIASIESYVIHLFSLVDIDEARQMLKNDMASALEILSDSDPDNDVIGLSLLARIFAALGDKTGVLTALSLCDRPILKRRIKGETFGPESEGWYEARDSGMYRACDECRKDLFSSDKAGFWWCPICPGSNDWCSKCKDKSKGSPADPCSDDHIPLFIHLVHPAYTLDEVESTTVLVDWEYVDDESGGYTRKGGRRIELAEWVEELRKAWGLPKPEGDGSRAQQ